MRGRGAIGRGVAGWRAEIAEDAWLDRPEDVLVLCALRHIEHLVELAGGARIKARSRAFVDEDWHGRRHGAKARIGEVFAHELFLGDTGEPFESIGYAFREHDESVRGEDDEQPRKTAPALSGAETRVEVCLAEARCVERRLPFLDLPGRVRQVKAMVDAGDGRGWAPTDGGENRMEAGLPRALVEQLRQLLCPRRFARRMQVLRGIEQRVPG